MRHFATAVAALALVASAPVFATPISGLYNTGSAGLGKVDTNYHFAATQGVFDGVTYNAGTATGTDSAGVANGCTGGPDCFGVAGTYPAWKATDPNSFFLAPTAATGKSYDATATGSYTWTLDFNVSNFKSAGFAAQWASDNEGYVTLNGNVLPNSQINYGMPAFQSFTKFGANTSDFVNGTNQLVFHVFNVKQAMGNPTGLNVDFTNTNVVGAPVPASALLFVSAIGALVVFGRKKNRGELASVDASIAA